MEGRCPSIITFKFYLYNECLHSNLDILDGKNDVDPMIPEMIDNWKMSLAAKNIYLTLNFGSGLTNGTTKNGKYYLMQFYLI